MPFGRSHTRPSRWRSHLRLIGVTALITGALISTIVVLNTKAGIIAAVLLSTLAILLYCLRFSFQQPRNLALTERLLAQKYEDRLRTLTEKSAEIIMITSPLGEVTYIGSSVHSVLGWSDQEAIGTRVFEHIHPEDVAVVQAAFSAALATGETPTFEFRLRHADGHWADFECCTRNLIHDASVRGLLSNARDVTQRKKAEDLLAFNAAHDSLTRLPNRALFMDRLEIVVERKKRRPGPPAAVLFVDVDDFKVVNDDLGHDAGDLLLSEFGKRLKACVRSDDTVARPLNPRGQQPDMGTVARLGGDEFIILIEEIAHPSAAVSVARRIQALMTEPFVICDQEVFKSASIGIAFTSGETSARSVMANADIAMYRAKSNGKSRCEVFDDLMRSQITERLELEVALRQALKGNEFRLQYQPIVSLATGRIAGLEALVRWDRPGVGLVSPAAFIAIAEENGLIVQLGQWVLMEACRQAAGWVRDGAGPGPYVSVNVSARQFAYPDFVDQVRDTLRATGINPHRLKVELTESTAMEEPERAVDRMLQLAELGVTLSIDDFGTGYSSLSVLRRFPVKTLKIDRSFVATIHTNSQVAAIVTTICTLASILCMEVVAEGVENLEQLNKLQSAFCDCAQGYLFSRPLSADAVPGVLATNLLAGLEASSHLAVGAVR